MSPIRLMAVIRINRDDTKDERPFRWVLDVRVSWEKIKFVGEERIQDNRLGKIHKLILIIKGIRMIGAQKKFVLMLLRPGSKEEKMSINIIIWMISLKVLKTFSFELT